MSVGAATGVWLAGMRTSTLLTVLVFLGLGVFRDRRFWLAGLIWLGGYEVAYQVTQTARELVSSGFHPRAWWVPVVVFGVEAVGLGLVLVAARKGLRPSLGVAALFAVLWVVWVATGFHANVRTGIGFDPTTEALNEGTKTLWALAYLLPLWKMTNWLPVRTAGAS